MLEFVEMAKIFTCWLSESRFYIYYSLSVLLRVSEYS